jgi:hypothetical protein
MVHAQINCYYCIIHFKEEGVLCVEKIQLHESMVPFPENMENIRIYYEQIIKTCPPEELESDFRHCWKCFQNPDIPPEKVITQEMIELNRLRAKMMSR